MVTRWSHDFWTIFSTLWPLLNQQDRGSKQLGSCYFYDPVAVFSREISTCSILTLAQIGFYNEILQTFKVHIF